MSGVPRLKSATQISISWFFWFHPPTVCVPFSPPFEATPWNTFLLISAWNNYYYWNFDLDSMVSKLAALKKDPDAQKLHCFMEERKRRIRCIHQVYRQTFLSIPHELCVVEFVILAQMVWTNAAGSCSGNKKCWTKTLAAVCLPSFSSHVCKLIFLLLQNQGKVQRIRLHWRRLVFVTFSKRISWAWENPADTQTYYVSWHGVLLVH